MIRSPRPQRIIPLAPIGSLLKRSAAQLPNRASAFAEQRKGGDPDYLAKVRLLPCLKCGMEPSEAAHVKYSCAALGKTNKLGKRPDDCDTVPLCASCHREARDAQHQGNERAFWERLNLNPYLIARDLYAQRADFTAMHFVVVKAIVERSKPEAGQICPGAR